MAAADAAPTSEISHNSYADSARHAESRGGDTLDGEDAEQSRPGMLQLLVRWVRLLLLLLAAFAASHSLRQPRAYSAS